jgi:acyl carrier protein
MKPLNNYQKRQVRLVLSDKLGFDFKDITEEMDNLDAKDLKYDLGMDSLDAIEITMELENIFNIDIPDAEAEKVKIVSDIYDCLVNCN